MLVQGKMGRQMFLSYVVDADQVWSPSMRNKSNHIVL